MLALVKMDCTGGTVWPPEASCSPTQRKAGGSAPRLVVQLHGLNVETCASQGPRSPQPNTVWSYRSLVELMDDQVPPVLMSGTHGPGCMLLASHYLIVHMMCGRWEHMTRRGSILFNGHLESMLKTA